MHRFYIDPAESQGSIVNLREREAHHALHVLRLRTGDRVIGLDGAGHRLSCTVAASARDSVSLQVIAREFVPRRKWAVTLFQCLPKGTLIEAVIEKATQLGVSRVVPVLSERVVSRLAPKERERKRQKWQQVAIEAIKQCGSTWLPCVEVPAEIPEILSRKEEFQLPLIASLQPGSRHPSHWLGRASACAPDAKLAACVWIGPEGDFAPAEVEAIIYGSIAYEPWAACLAHRKRPPFTLFRSLTTSWSDRRQQASGYSGWPRINSARIRLGAIDIPGAINGLPVTSIGWGRGVLSLPQPAAVVRQPYGCFRTLSS